ncbi:hypothetical protein EPN42_01730 [bacterium]|nr:MAG: hypothetical protein EPN42_01730 [bacterium]
MGESVIVDAVRTPIGKAQGGLPGVPPARRAIHFAAWAVAAGDQKRYASSRVWSVCRIERL